MSTTTDPNPRVVVTSSIDSYRLPGALGTATGGTSASAYQVAAAASKVDIADGVGPATAISDSVFRAVVSDPQTLLAIRPLLLGADNSTGEIRVWRHFKVVDTTKDGAVGSNREYMTSELAGIVTCVACSRTGAGGAIPSTWRHCDSYTISSQHGLFGGLMRSTQPSGGADDTPAEIIVDCLGAVAIEIEAKVGTATRIAAMYRNVTAQ